MVGRLHSKTVRQRPLHRSQRLLLHLRLRTLHLALPLPSGAGSGPQLGRHHVSTGRYGSHPTMAQELGEVIRNESLSLHLFQKRERGPHPSPNLSRARALTLAHAAAASERGRGLRVVRLLLPGGVQRRAPRGSRRRGVSRWRSEPTGLPSRSAAAEATGTRRGAAWAGWGLVISSSGKAAARVTLCWRLKVAGRQSLTREAHRHSRFLLYHFAGGVMSVIDATPCSISAEHLWSPGVAGPRPRASRERAPARVVTQARPTAAR